MTPRTKTTDTTYHPHHDGSDEQHPSWWQRSRPSDLVSLIMLVTVAGTLLGIRLLTPTASINALEARTTKLEHRVDSLFEFMQLNSYMQCVSLRMDHPELLPPGCAPIIESRGRK